MCRRLLKNVAKELVTSIQVLVRDQSRTRRLADTIASFWESQKCVYPTLCSFEDVQED